MSTQEIPTLEVTSREKSGKGVARKLRAEGLIPAVCYGGGAEARALTIDPEVIIDLFEDSPRGKNTLFHLQVEGGDKIDNVMVKDYQVHPVRRELMHVDFFVVDLDNPVRVRVPIKAVGRAKGVREGGILNVIRPDIDVVARPLDIPVVIEIDVTSMAVGDTMQAEDIELPEDVQPGFRANYGLLTVVIPRKKAALLKAEAAEGEAVAEA